MNRTEILSWLRETSPERLAELWRQADETRRRFVGDEVHLRGLIEISNHCARECAYCGIRAGHKSLPRYRMSAEEIFGCARQAVDFGYGTVVVQAGEDYGLTRQMIAGLIRLIKSQTKLAVTLSLGERPEEDLAAWREAGANRYLLRFETSDAELFGKIHPAGCGGAGDVLGSRASSPPPAGKMPAVPEHPRVAVLRFIKKLGYEIGSGVMVGLPGQSYESIAGDLELFAALDLDMIGVGPYIAHPDTPLGQEKGSFADQAPNSEELVYKVVALARLMCPEANIPSTTALATINPRDGRELGLQRGANVVMPNLTPQKYRALYEIYPAKACIQESAAICHGCLGGRILALGRKIGMGQGGRVRRNKLPS
jgi:biotin synthase